MLFVVPAICILAHSQTIPMVDYYIKTLPGEIPKSLHPT